jgi:glycerol-3-phosphate dehydrogenase
MSERVVDIACERLREQGREQPQRVGESDQVTLSGGDTGDDVAAYAIALSRKWPEVGADVVDRLVTLYGSNAERMVEAMGADPVLAERFAPDPPVTRAEVQYAVREEMAQTLEDFLERRARLMLWDPGNGLAVAEGVARVMGNALGWSAERVRREVAEYRDHVESVKSFQGAEPEAEAAQAAHG